MGYILGGALHVLMRTDWEPWAWATGGRGLWDLPGQLLVLTRCTLFRWGTGHTDRHVA